MIRYVAIAWDPDSAPEQSTVFKISDTLRLGRGMEVALRRPGLLVMVTGCEDSSDCIVLQPGNGLVLGVVFKGKDLSTPQRIRTFDYVAASDVVATRGKALIKRYWGKYVAFIAGLEAGSSHIVRSPASDLCCFYMKLDGMSLFFSDLSDLHCFVFRRFRIDWNYIGMHLVIPRHSEKTGFEGVKELRPGYSAQVTLDNIQIEDEWRPHDIPEVQPRGFDVEEIAEQLRTTARYCVHAWASLHANIILNLSGGLDSSIIAGLLCDAPNSPGIYPLNFYAKGAESDERQYAREAAARLGCLLVERERSGVASFLGLFGLPVTARPGSYTMTLDRVEVESELAASSGATATFSGHGGDEIFFAGAHEYSPTDLLRHRGLSTPPRILLHLAACSAVREQTSIWPVAYKTLIRTLSTRPMAPFPKSVINRYRQLLAPHLLYEFQKNQWAHYTWSKNSGRLSCGRQYQLLMLEEPIDFHGPLGSGGPDQISPLSSQPLIEFSLGIPSYIFSPSGQNRELARKAFAAEVPGIILQRTSKGRIENWAEARLRQDAAELRERVLDGELIKRGLLDRKKTERALLGFFSDSIESASEVTDIIEVEGWLQSAISVTNH